jgi:benzoyl-CoA reductase/2-hydroxyglutaryl-CoA dehydratase subunit BcrC/BadD/HgdB
MKDFATFLERQLNRPFSENKFQKVGLLSFEAIKLWKEILELTRERPAPLTAFDAFIHMAPIVTLRGTRWAVWYYRKLKKEIEERVKKGIGAFAHEEIRLIWDNIPIWYDIRNLSKILSSQGRSRGEYLHLCLGPGSDRFERFSEWPCKGLRDYPSESRPPI